MQKVTLIGNLGQDPEERYTSSNKKVVTFSFAVGIKKDVVVWYQVNIWEERIPMFEGMLKSLRKGSKVCIMGDLGAPQPYTTKNGEPGVRMHVQPFSMTFVGIMTGEKKPETLEKKPETLASLYDKDLPF